MGLEFDTLTAYFTADLTEFDSSVETAEKRLNTFVNNAAKLLDNLEKRFKSLKLDPSSTTTTKSPGGDPEMAKAQADILRFKKQREQWAAETTAFLDKEAEKQYRNEVKYLQKGLSEFQKVLSQEKKTPGQNLNVGGFLKDAASATAAGSFIGASTGTIVGLVASKSIEEIINLSKQIYELGKSVLQMGADFEQTRNSIAVFAGGASNAERELAALDATARNTPGLRMEPAEEGYRALRALGFEADNARKLIAGIGKERLLSGATEQDVARVIVNLTQLSAGSSRASADIREMYHAMPSLRKEFALAFGTLDPKKIGDMFGKDPQEAVRKLSEQLEKSKGAAGGLNDAYGKLSDEVVFFGREVSKSTVPILTEQIRGLTQFIRENSDAWSVLGVRIANMYDAFSRSPTVFHAIKNFSEIAHISDEESFQIYRQRRLKAVSFEEFVQQRTGLSVEQLKSYNNALLALIGGTGGFYFTSESDISKKRMQDLRVAYNEMLNQRESDALRPERESAAKQAMADAQVAFQNAVDKAREQEKEFVESSFAEQLTIRKNFYAVDQALLQSHLDLTLQSQLKTLRAVGQSKEAGIRSELALETAKYNKLIALADGDEQEVAKLTLKRNEMLSNLGAQLKQAEIENRKAIAQKEYQIEEQRRQALIQFKKLQIRDAETYSDARIYDLERAIAAETETTAGGYRKIVELTRSNFERVRALTEDSYRLQLQDRSLSNEQRLNLIQEMYQEEQKQAEDNRRRILEIEEKQYQESLRRLNTFYATIQSSRDSSTSIIGSLKGVLGEQFGISNLDLGQVKSALFSNIIDPDRFLSLYRQLGEAEKTGAANAGEIRAAFEESGSVTERLSAQFYTLIQNFDGSTEAVDRLRQAQKLLVAMNFGEEIGKAADQVKLMQTNIELYIKNAKEKNQSNLTSAEDKYKQLTKDRENLLKEEDSPIKKDLLSSLENRIKQQASVVEDWKKSLGEKVIVPEELNKNLYDAQNKLDVAKLQQWIASYKEWINTAEGSKYIFDQLSAGNEKYIGSLRDAADNQLWKEKVGLISQIKTLEMGYYRDSQLWSLKRKEALIQYEREIFEAEQNRIIQSQITVSQRLRRQLADTQSYTDIFKGYIGSLPVQMADQFSQGLQSWDGSWKGFLSMMRQTFAQLLSDLAAQMLRAAVIKLVANLIGSLAGGLGGGSGAAGAPGGGPSAGPIPGHWLGGDMSAGELGIVGEKGPELFVPRSAGTIITADKTKEILSGRAAGGDRVSVVINQNFKGNRQLTARASSRQAAEGAAKGISQGLRGRR